MFYCDNIKICFFWCLMCLGSEQLYQAFWMIDISFYLSQRKQYYLLKSSVCVCALNFFRDCCDLNISVEYKEQEAAVLININETVKYWREYLLISVLKPQCQTEKDLIRVKILVFDSTSPEITSINSFDFKQKKNHHNTIFSLCILKLNKMTFFRRKSCLK